MQDSTELAPCDWVATARPFSDRTRDRILRSSRQSDQVSALGLAQRGGADRVTGSRMRILVGAVLMSFVLAMVIGVSGVIAPGGGAALGASTTLTIIGGDVQVSRQGAPFESAADGAILSPGDVIRTGADSRAVLTYFEGSTVSIEPSSELAIDEASAAPDGSTVVVMTQNLGRTWHVVTKLITGGSKYEVRTPAATASVRGTAFEVGVVRQADGQTTTAIVTTEGAVAAAAPATAAQPEPEPVVVPAGFQTTARSSERKPETPTLAPEPERKVTVNVSNENSVVVDPLGRSNGMKDGKLVLQTPGAQVVKTDGKLTITLPNLPDGKLSTVVSQAPDAPSNSTNNNNAPTPAAAPVQVVTTVEERGKAPATVSETVQPAAQPVTTGVDVKKSGPGPEATPDVRPVTEDEKKELPTPKTVVEPEKVEESQAPVFRPGLGADPKVIQKIVEERKAVPEEKPATPVTPVVAPARAAQPDAPKAAAKPESKAEEQQPADAPAKAEERPAPTPGFVPQINFHGAPNAASQQREEAKKEEQRGEDDRKAATETKKDASDIKATEQLQKAAQVAEQIATAAQSKAGDEGKKADEEKARAERAAREAEAARLKAERERREAEERAAKAASEAARRAAAEEAKAKAAEQERAEQQKRAAERAAREAEAEAREQARQQEKARQAEQTARELRERLERHLQELQRKQQRASKSGSSDNDRD